jgi:hypothetical protein
VGGFMIDVLTGLIVALTTESITKSAGPMARATGLIKPSRAPEWLVKSLTPSAADNVRTMLSDLVDSNLSPTTLTQVALTLRSAEANKLQRSLVINILIQRPMPQPVLVEEVTALLIYVGSLSQPEAAAISPHLSRTLSSAAFRGIKALRDVSRQNFHIAVQLAHQEIAAGYLESLNELLSGNAVPFNTSQLSKLSRFVKVYTEELVARTQDLIPQHFDTQTRVPIDQLYVAPTFSAVGEDVRRLAPMTDGIDATREKIVFPYKHALRRMYRTVVLGAPGAGKTTLTQKLMYDLCAQPSITATCVPFLITLRKYEQYRGDNALSFIAFIAAYISGEMQVTVSESQIRYLLHAGRALVIFDGLDELLQPNRRKDIVGAVESFARRYTESSIIVTSRIIGYEEAPLNARVFAKMHLDEFDNEGVAAYVSNWFNLSPRLSSREKAVTAGAFLKDSESVSDLRSNPLMLSLMCNIYRGAGSIPQNRADLYEKCATMLFEQWDESRGIKSGGPLKADARFALQDVAYWVLTDRNVAGGIPHALLERRLTKFLALSRYGAEGPAREAAAELLRLWRGRAWILTDLGSDSLKPIYQFTHRTFLEYFGALYLARSSNSPRALWMRLRERTVSSQWDVVAQIAIQSYNGSHIGTTDKIYEIILAEVGRYEFGGLEALRFACRYIDALLPSPKTVRKLVAIALRLVFITLPSFDCQPRYDHYEYERDRNIPQVLATGENYFDEEEDEDEDRGDVAVEYTVEQLIEPLALILNASQLIVRQARETIDEACRELINSSDLKAAALGLLVLLCQDDFVEATRLLGIANDNGGIEAESEIVPSDDRLHQRTQRQWIIGELRRLRKHNFWLPIEAGKRGLLSFAEIYQIGGLPALFNSASPFGFGSFAAVAIVELIMHRNVRGELTLQDLKLLSKVGKDAKKRFSEREIAGQVEADWSPDLRTGESLVRVAFLDSAQRHATSIIKEHVAINTDQALGFGILLATCYELERWNLDDYSDDQLADLILGPFQFLDKVILCRYTSGDYDVPSTGLDSVGHSILRSWALNRFNFVAYHGRDEMRAIVAEREQSPTHHQA